MKKIPILSAFFLLLFVIVLKAEERLSWFTTDPPDVRESVFVPDNLSEGKEENRVLPWVFNSPGETKIIQLKCIMRGYNASNNPIGYKDARWSHPGFDDSQVNTSTPAARGDEDGVAYAIWTIVITISAEDAGKKLATCDWQQGDFPLSVDFEFLIFKRLAETETRVLSFGLGEQLYENDLTQQIEDDIKKQISERLSVPASTVSRSEDGQRFTVFKEQVCNMFVKFEYLPPVVQGNTFQAPDLVDDSKIGENTEDGGRNGDEDVFNDSDDGWSTASIALISLLVIVVVAAILFFVIYFRPDQYFNYGRESSSQQADQIESSV